MGSGKSCAWIEYCVCHSTGVQKEPHGDCEEADGAYGQGWGYNIQRWTTLKNYSDLFPE